MNSKLYTLIQWTWGLPQTLAGAGLYIAHRKDRHFDYNGARATVWDRDAGISLGKFIFLPAGRTAHEDPEQESSSHMNGSGSHSFHDDYILRHEYGHTIQSLILGPAYLLLVGAPSMLWNRLPYFANRRKVTGRSYYSAVFERTANMLGEKHAAR